MTRINLVPVQELMDQHLFAEFREIKMIPAALNRSINAAIKRSGNYTKEIKNSIPEKFCLNSGHVLFFFDKGVYLQNRYTEICAELDRRGVNYDKTAVLDKLGVFTEYPQFMGDYQPDAAAFKIIRERIQQKIDMKPTWYRKTSYVS